MSEGKHEIGGGDDVPELGPVQEANEGATKLGTRQTREQVWSAAISVVRRHAFALERLGRLTTHEPILAAAHPPSWQCLVA